jgi:hypothetical protein
MSEADAAHDEAEIEIPEADVAFVVPLEKYVYKLNGRWQLDNPVNEKGISGHLSEVGWSNDMIKAALQPNGTQKVYGLRMEPNQPDLFVDPATGRKYLNCWVEPNIEPVAGEYPSIKRILMWLMDNDVEGYEWVKHWLAQKIQNPRWLPKIAIVFITKQGAGKGSLFRVLSKILGEENCAEINRKALDSTFNARWITKLFLLANEIVNTDNFSVLKEDLKSYIDSPVNEMQGKFKDQRSVPNYLAWIFATNDNISPVVVEQGDRRYTIFSNQKDATEQKAFCDSLYEEKDNSIMKEHFVKEIQAFYHDLLNTEVNHKLIRRPFENGARNDLIQVSLTSWQAFLEYVEEESIDPLLEKLRRTGELHSIGDYDFGEDGVSREVVFVAYRAFCKQTGYSGILKQRKFGQAVKERWPTFRATIKSNGRRVWCYQVPRGDKFSGTPLKIVGDAK